MNSNICMTSEHNSSPWVNEWRAMLKTKFATAPHSRIEDPLSHKLLQCLAETLYIVYDPAMYDEYLSKYDNYMHIRSLEDRMIEYAYESPIVLAQVTELKNVYKLEQFSIANRIVYHEDSIIERVALAAHFAGDRMGG